MAKEKLSKEEKVAQKARQQQIRQAECRDKGHSRRRKPDTGEMKKALIEDMYQAELDTHLGYGKNEERPEESENYRNGSYHVRTSRIEF